MKKIVISFISIFLVGVTGFVYAKDVENLRGQRYCEILLGSNQLLAKEIHVYNTIGLNDCPQNLWEKITEESVKKETNAKFVHLNGPRYWVIDGMQNSSLVNTEKKVFGGIAMRDAGTLILKFSQWIKGQKPYKGHEVDRKTTWVYLAKKRIYELVDPAGNIYIMQSYSVQKTPQTEESLKDLGTKLHLSENWGFRTRILQNDAFLTPVNQRAVVIQDDYLNTYQLETPDFMKQSGAKE